MTVEAAAFISQLDATYPASGDAKSEGDNHLRLIKTAVKGSFPNLTAVAVTATSAELNFVVGVTSAVQTQLNAEAATRLAADALKADLASPALTGTPTAPTAASTASTTQIATTAMVQGALVAYSGTNLGLPTFSGADANKLLSLDGSGAGYVWSAVSALTVDGTNAIGFRHIPQISQSDAYTCVLTDAGKHILHPSADTTARTFTIPANSSVAYALGTAITFINQNAGGVITIAITTDTMRLAGAGTTGSRTLAANGVATAIKLTATEWIISGSGLT